MSKKIYIGGADNKSRKGKKIYIGDADNKARKVKKIYIGDADGKARLGYSSGASAYVAAGLTSTGMRISDDGITWRKVTDTIPHTIDQIVYGNGVYVAVCRDHYLAYSTDGINWTYQEMDAAVYGVAFGYGRGSFAGTSLFLAVGYSGSLWTSPDGMTWTKLARWTTSSYTGVLYGNGKFLAWVGTTLSYSTTNGKAWNSGEAPNPTNFTLQSICFANGKFYALYYYNNNEINYRIYESSDALEWEEIRYGSDSTVPEAVAYGNGVTVFAGRKGKALVYSDTSNIPTEAKITERDTFRCHDLIYSGGKFVAVGRSSDSATMSIYYSLDGYNWVPIDYTSNKVYYTVCKGTD